jgi:glutaredoxin
MARKRYHMVIKESCSYCQKAMALLDSKGFQYDTDPMDDEPDLLLEIKKKIGFESVPMIWEIEHRERRFIGGYAELVQHFMSSEKKKLIHG